jgi:tripartite-type tricarboxylate transporter receptor subunit TctC
MVSGQVDVMFLNAGPAEATARDGKMRILGVGAAERILQLSATPTLAELGMPIDEANWFGVLGPAGLPDDVAARLATVTAEAVATPQVQETFRVQTALPVTGTPAEMRNFLATDRACWTAVVKDLDIRLE